jgi:hypothetical protein
MISNFNELGLTELGIKFQAIMVSNGSNLKYASNSLNCSNCSKVNVSAGDQSCSDAHTHHQNKVVLAPA